VKKLEQYIGHTVLKTTLTAVLLLLGVACFLTFVSQLHSLGKGDYDIWAALIYVVAKIPGELYYLFPIASLLGVVLALGIFAAGNELVGMRVAGLSIADILRLLFKIMLFVVIGVTLFGEFVSPYSEHYATQFRTLARSGGKALATKRGIWVRKNNTFIHIAALMPGKKLSGVTQYTFDKNHQLARASYSESAKYYDQHWHLYNTKESIIYDKKVEVQSIPEMAWSLQLNPELLDIAKSDPEEMRLIDLRQYIKYLDSNGLSSRPYAVEFWQRVSQPLLVLIMMVLGGLLVFGPLRSATLSLRLLGSASLGFVFYLLDKLSGPFSVYFQIPALLAAALPIIVFSLIAVILLRYAR